MCIEKEISSFMLRFSKFEFYLIDMLPELIIASGCPKCADRKITGLDWNKLAAKLEKKITFACIKSKNMNFHMLIDQHPQYLVITPENKIKWDSDVFPINSWNDLLVKGLAQLRNNIAHGNKNHITAPFTHERTKDFLISANYLLNFIIETLLPDHKPWEMEITFYS